MKGIFWNCNGFADVKKYRFLSDLTKEKNLDFIALSETGRGSFLLSTLNNICAGRDFVWHCMAPRGRSGGMLLGINLVIFDIGEIDEGDFLICFKLRHKHDDIKFNLISVYGPAQLDQKSNFLSEFLRICSKETLPLVIGGDFSIIRRPGEKNNNNYSDRWPFLFNVVIDTLNLRELEMSCRRFTWANHMQNQTFEKLDRVLVCNDFEFKFPHSTLHALSREISYHTPLFLNTNNPSSSYQPQFKFELRWLMREGFCDMVQDVWNSVIVTGTPLERWQAKIRRLRQYLRGWAKNISGAYKKEKQTLLNKLDEIDKKRQKVLF
jgi:exonuclease III